MITPDQLIPPDSELAHLLLQWSEEQDSRIWHIADVTNDLIAEVEGGEITKQDIYKAVATRCRGQRPNTIRRIAEVAVDFDLDARKKYADILSFSHFKMARRLYNEGRTPYLTYALEWAVEGNDDKISAGRFHTVGEMLLHFLPEDAFENQLKKYWGKVKEKLYDLALIHDHDNERARLLRAWNDIEEIVSRLDTSEKV